MRSCPEHEETLWLDVHGELEPDRAREWQAHLKGCPACQEERRQLVRLLEESLRVLTPAQATPAEEARLGRAVLSGIEGKQSRRFGFPGLSLPWPPRPAFALAAACLAVLAVGWIWSGPGQGPLSLQTASRPSAPVETAGMTRNLDGEILQNLELLEDLDVIEKVVTVIDHKQVSM